MKNDVKRTMTATTITRKKVRISHEASRGMQNISNENIANNFKYIERLHTRTFDKTFTSVVRSSIGGFKRLVKSDESFCTTIKKNINENINNLFFSPL